MKKKKVLFLINNLGGGGAERVLVNLVNNMEFTKFDVTVRTLIDKGENKQFLSSQVNYESVFKNGFRGINYLRLLPKKYIYNKVAHGIFDVIIVYLHGVLTKIIANAPKEQKTIAYLHANMTQSPFIKSFKTKDKIQNCFKTYNAIISVSKSVEDSFKEVSGLNEKLHVIYNTFNVKKIIESSLESVETGIYEDNVLNIISVGKLNKVKGYDRLISVMGKIKNDGINFNLIIVGEGAERENLEKIIQDNELENKVKLIGFHVNPYKFIDKSDLFVSSSLSEGFSSVVAESIILGIPVLTTETAGMKEILGENNEYGIVVNNDENSLYESLKKLLLDKELLNHYKLKANERSSFFSTEKSVKDVENLIEKTCQ